MADPGPAERGQLVQPVHRRSHVAVGVAGEAVERVAAVVGDDLAGRVVG
jgi:hypothetical protein